MYWECSCLVGYEDGSYKPAGSSSRIDVLTSLRRVDSSSPATQAEAIRTWYSTVVRDFMATYLAQSTDKLSALAGIAKYFASAYCTKSIVRVWIDKKDSIASIYGLLWHGGLCCLSRVWRAPTFSWAAFEGIMSHPPVFGPWARTVIARYLDHSIELENSVVSTCGRVNGGWFALSAPLYEIGAAVFDGVQAGDGRIELHLATVPPEEVEILRTSWVSRSQLADYGNGIDISELRVALLTTTEYSNHVHFALILRCVRGIKALNIVDEVRSQRGLKVAAENIFERIGDVEFLSIDRGDRVPEEASFFRLEEASVFTETPALIII